MCDIKIVWENVNCPSDLGELTLVKGDLKIYTPYKIPGVFAYNVKTRNLGYFDYSSNPDITIIKCVLRIISLCVNKMPSEISLPT